MRYLHLLSVSVALAGCTRATASPTGHAVRMAAWDWLKQHPDFVAQVGDQPGGVSARDQYAQVIVSSRPPHPLQGVLRLERLHGSWHVVSANTRPTPKAGDIAAVMFQFTFSSSGKARDIRITGCRKGLGLKTPPVELPDALTAADKAEGIRIIASRTYHPSPERIDHVGYDSLMFDIGNRRYLEHLDY